MAKKDDAAAPVDDGSGAGVNGETAAAVATEAKAARAKRQMGFEAVVTLFVPVDAGDVEGIAAGAAAIKAAVATEFPGGVSVVSAGKPKLTSRKPA